MHHHVGIGQHIMHRVGDGRSHLLGALEGDIAGHADREVGKVAIAGAPDAYPVHFEQAIHARNRGDNLVAHSRRSGIEQSVDRLAGQPPAHVDHHAGHEQRSHRIGVAQPVDIPDSPQQNQEQTENHDPARPDVGGEVQRIGFERLAVVLGCDPAQGARSPEIHPHGDKHHDESGDAGLDVDVMEEEPLDGFVDDPDTGEQEQAGFEEGRKIFHFAVSVLVIGVGGLVGDSNRHQGDDRGDQIERGMQRFRKYAQAAGGDAHHNFQRGDGDRGQNGISRHRALFGAHRLRTVDRRRSRHSGIIAGRAENVGGC